MSYATKPLVPGDRGQEDALVRLWTENLSDRAIAQVARERLRWFYDQQPIAPARTVLAVHEESGEVVGCGTCIPRRLWVLGRSVLAAIPCDFAVARKHRVGGAAMAIQRELTGGSRAAGFELLLGSPNEKSLPIVKRAGYRVVGAARAYVKPLRAAYKIEAKLGRPRLARAAGVVVDAGLRLYDALRVPRRRLSYRSEILERPDARFDALWARGRGAYTIVGEKTAAYLDWRYARFTTKTYRFFTLAERRGGALAGFVVYTVRDGKVFVDDLFAADQAETLDQLLRGFVARMRDEGHASVYLSFVGPAAWAARFERLGFWRGTDPGRQLVVFVGDGADAALAAAVADENQWFLCDGEMDI
jgi:hypothetical protein